MAWQKTRDSLSKWRKKLADAPWQLNPDFQHSMSIYFAKQPQVMVSLAEYGQQLPEVIELAGENDQRMNLPRLEQFDADGTRCDKVHHHPSYLKLGQMIYGSGMMQMLLQPGRLLESLSHFYLSAHAGEAGHHCPLACTAGVIRVLNTVEDFPEKEDYLKKLTQLNFADNYTGAQFVTEIQGGSDVGQNACRAVITESGQYQIVGEKWFCSNADAELILMTARFDQTQSGTKGLGLFLVPRTLADGRHNHYQICRLKEKLGTRSMASGEIIFNGAHAVLMGEQQQSFKLLMEQVLHTSRIYNSFACLGLSSQAWIISYYYSQYRQAFGQPIFNYPLIQENLCMQRCENAAMMALTIHITALQDQYDLSERKQLNENEKLKLRLWANLAKHMTAERTVSHIRCAIDVLGGNGAIESFSILPRLLRDSIVYENWEGTHNTLFMQILRDSHKYNVDHLFFDELQQQLSLLKRVGDYPQWQLALDNLSEQFSNMKQKSHEIQALQIKTIVGKMWKLACCIALLNESYPDDSQKNNPVKREMAEFLFRQYFSTSKNEDLSKNLETMKRINNDLTSYDTCQ